MSKNKLFNTIPKKILFIFGVFVLILAIAVVV